MRKTHIAAIAALLFLPACAGMPGIGPSGPTQTAANVAQTARDQAAVPSNAYGGQVTFNFASTTTAAVQEQLIAFAKEANATPEQLTAILAATNGAPENVNITTANIEGGAADAAGSGTGGAASGTSGAEISR